MKKNPAINFLLFLFLFIACSLLLETVACADTHTATDCSYSAVSNAIGLASPEDTVLVPAGSATWNSQLIITKGINLIGGNGGTTKITAGERQRLDSI